ncbi:MAG: DNA repair protein RadC [Spirochaetaceae bacterium]|nr:DNA repair protein RadC [Spirochaetaceae bacterium]
MKYQIKQNNSLNIHEIPLDSRPRERMKTNGVSSLSDEELVAVLLGSGSKGNNVAILARNVIDVLDKKPNATYEDLLRIKGLGPAKISLICSALEIGRRRIPLKKRQVIEPKDAYKLVCHYSTRKQEQFVVISVNSAYEAISVDVASMGTVNQCMVHPREVFAPAISKSAIAVILTHNHPTGNLTPSNNDLMITKRLKQCGEILGIRVIDHIIFSEDNFHSMEDEGEL